MHAASVRGRRVEAVGPRHVCIVWPLHVFAATDSLHLQSLASAERGRGEAPGKGEGRGRWREGGGRDHSAKGKRGGERNRVGARARAESRTWTCLEAKRQDLLRSKPHALDHGRINQGNVPPHALAPSTHLSERCEMCEMCACKKRRQWGARQDPPARARRTEADNEAERPAC